MLEVCPMEDKEPNCMFFHYVCPICYDFFLETIFCTLIGSSLIKGPVIDLFLCSFLLILPLCLDYAEFIPEFTGGLTG